MWTFNAQFVKRTPKCWLYEQEGGFNKVYMPIQDGVPPTRIAVTVTVPVALRKPSKSDPVTTPRSTELETVLYDGDAPPWED